MFLEVVTSLFFVWLIWWIVKTYQERRGMPPGPIPLPVIGNLWQMRLGLLPSFDKLRERYGDIFTLSLALGTVVVVNSGKLAREALSDRKDDMAGRVPETFYPLDIIMEGKDIVLEDFSPKLLFRRKVFKSAMHVYGTFGVEQADKRAHNASQNLVGEIMNTNGRLFSPKKHVRLAMISSIWQWLSSKKYPLVHPTTASLDDFITKITTLGSFAGIFKFIPMAQYFPTKFNEYLKEVENIKEDIFADELRVHRQSYSSGIIRDLTDSFISAYKKETTRELGNDLGSVDDVKGLMMNAIVAGVDPSSAYVTWFILYMALNQDVQGKVHSELDRVVGRGRYPLWSDGKDLHYFQATTLEVMRHSSALHNFQRNAFRDTTIGRYRIPKRTSVLFNNSFINKDPREWEKPKSFRPDRFLDADGRFVGWTAFPAFLPFGLGLRRCAGEPLAKINMFSFMSTLLHHFKFGLPEGEARPVVETVEAGMLWPNDFKVSAIKRF